MCPQGANVAGTRPELADSTSWTRAAGAAGSRLGFRVVQDRSLDLLSPMIKCPGADLKACALTEHEVHGGTSGFLQGLTQIPGADDLLLANDEKTFRYNISTGALTEIYNVSSMVCPEQARFVAGSSCVELAGASPAAVSAEAPPSRLQPGREIARAERSVQSPRRGVCLGRGEQSRRPNPKG